MDLKRIGKVVGVGTLIASMGGLVAPIVGLGLGLVTLNSVITRSLSTIAAIGVVSNLTEAKKSERENKKLRDELKKANIDNKAKQNVIKSLNKQLEEVKAELRFEHSKRKRNEEKIRLMEEQLDDLMETLQTAYAV